METEDLEQHQDERQRGATFDTADCGSHSCLSPEAKLSSKCPSEGLCGELPESTCKRAAWTEAMLCGYDRNQRIVDISVQPGHGKVLAIENEEAESVRAQGGELVQRA